MKLNEFEYLEEYSDEKLQQEIDFTRIRLYDILKNIRPDLSLELYNLVWNIPALKDQLLNVPDLDYKKKRKEELKLAEKRQIELQMKIENLDEEYRMLERKYNFISELNNDRILGHDKDKIKKELKDHRDKNSTTELKHIKWTKNINQLAVEILEKYIEDPSRYSFNIREVIQIELLKYDFFTNPNFKRWTTFNCVEKMYRNMKKCGDIWTKAQQLPEKLL